MEKRKLTAAEERRMTAKARELRDAEAELRVVSVRPRPDATAVLSVRLQLEQIRFLRDIASRKGVSLSALLQEVSGALASSEAQRMSISRGVSRVQVAGIGLEATVFPEGASAARWQSDADPLPVTA
jgi:hypothetical protein